MSIDSNDFKNFSRLPSDLQNEIGSYLSEKDAHRLVLSNPKYFRHKLDDIPVLAKKYYTYVINQKIPTLLKSDKKIEKYARSLFVPKDKKVESLGDILKPQKAENFLTRLNLKGVSSDELDIIIRDLPGEMQNLTYLNLERSKITASQLKDLLKKCPNLKHLNLSNCNSLENFKSGGLELKKLKKLEFQSYQDEGNTLRELLEISPHIQFLDIRNYRGDDLDFGNLQLLELKEINCPFAGNIDRNDFNALVKLAPNLEILNLNTCRFLEGFDFNDLKLVKLKKLDLGESLITATDLRKIAELAPNLEVLNVENCTKIVNVDFSNFQLLKLKDLNLSSLYMKKSELDNLHKFAPNLEELNLFNCPYVDPQNFDSNDLNLPKLQKVDFNYRSPFN